MAALSTASGERSTHLHLGVFAQHVEAPAYGSRRRVVTLRKIPSCNISGFSLVELTRPFEYLFKMMRGEHHGLIRSEKKGKNAKQKLLFLNCCVHWSWAKNQLTANMKVLVSSRISWSVRPSLRNSRSKSNSAKRCLAAHIQKVIY
jgi:hypothetical protein